ncbi:MAG: GAF domain-containing protein [Anaerolineae bacterium]|nr:GAF domain-containing protein [Anaerolineae bacterium]
MTQHEERITQYIAVTEQIAQGNFDVSLPAAQNDEFDRLGQSLHGLAKALEARYREVQKLNLLTARINAGLLLDEVLEGVYRDFKEFIPYNRIGFSGIEKDGTLVRSYWAKTDQPAIKLWKGYAAKLSGSSLEQIIATRQPRIINDLHDYLEHKPDSQSTRLIVAEGIRSSLTCPLVANGTPIGFIFFSSVEPNTYADAHIEIFQSIANQLAIIVEKGRLISELADQKAAIEQQNEQLRNLNDLKNTFLGIAAHDLRNPIGHIRMTTEILLDRSAGFTLEDHYGLLEGVYKQAQYMLTLLDDLLDVSYIESGKFSLNPLATNLPQFIQRAIERNAKLAETKGTIIVLEAGEEGLAWFDPLRIDQVMDNLLSNAVKYSPPGSVIRVRVRQAAPMWRIEVQDQGPGVTVEDQQMIFQDFARLSAKPTGGEKSTGLGLAITRRVVVAHGGDIGVDSETGNGATFWLTLPDVPA